MATTEALPTYAEARWWFNHLGTFTPSDLAGAMRVNTAVAVQYIKAGIFHGIVADTGVSINGTGPEEDVYFWVPLPPGPKEHETRTPPEILVGYTDVLCPRGLPVRLVDNTERRNMMQGTGGTRLRVKQRDRAYERMQEAIRKRQEKNRMKERQRHEDPKGKRNKQEDLPA